MRNKIISYIDNIIYNMNEKEKLFYLDICNYLHFVLDMCLFSYLFIFPVFFDFYLALILFFQALHWLYLKNECIIGYIEKKIENKNYNLGDKFYYVPHEKRFYNNLFILLKSFIITSIVIYLFYRNKGITKLLFGIIIIIAFYHTICIHLAKNKDEQKEERDYLL